MEVDADDTGVLLIISFVNVDFSWARWRNAFEAEVLGSDCT